MPRAPAKLKVRMCQRCNGGFIERFEKLLEDKNVKLEKKCVGNGKCGQTTPFCRIDKKEGNVILEAATVEELAALVG
ncbi:MAG: hypothetical protein FWH10_01645 [Oscillospiraceae bacterium]|nr:hypothetical protein [Oscillospiraceae bacterium]